VADPTPKEIRDAYQDYRDAWREIRDEAAEDMRAISPEGPWSDEDRDARKGSGRPCIHLDQLNQFLAQVNGNVRKSKRSIKAIPKGNGANDQDAQKRSAAIMGIEERSQAQPIYLNAFQSMIERSYGFAVIRTEYVGDGFDLEILIKPVMNPDTVLLSPYYKQPSGSDVLDGFFLDLMPKDKYKKKYKGARLTDFGDQDLNDSTITDWIKDKYLQVAEYWKVHTQLRTKLLIRGKAGPTEIWEDELQKGARGQGGRFLSPRDTVEIIRERDVETPEVFQYMTNGLEILDKVPWDGTRIPIIPCFGLERWTTEGGKPKRQLLSMVRFARDPQMLLDYLASGECEEAGQIPKSPFVGYVGQFETDKEAWGEVTKVPHAYLQTDIVIDQPTQTVLPVPARPQWAPNFQVWEVAKDAAGRAVQAAMGITPLPDAAQRRNQKSGVALEKIDDMESLGSFQFVDRYENGFLHNMGWQINELITPVLDTQREMPISSPDGKRSTMQLVGNTSHPIDDTTGAYEVQGLDEGHLHTGKGEFDVTIDTGPSYQSEREEQDDFVDTLIQNIANLPQPGTPAAKVFALGIRMRPTLGPVGQQIADVFDPPPPDPNMPPQAQAAIQQLQQQLQQAIQENSALHLERAGKVLEQQTKLIMQQMKEDGDNQRAQLANDIKILIAEISAKSQSQSERAQMYETYWKENHTAAHEAGLQAMEHQHDAQQQQQLATLAAQSPSLQPGQPGAPTAAPGPQ
jgi:hypothetical protein